MTFRHRILVQDGSLAASDLEAESRRFSSPTSSR
jgi:hypothetical protein